MADGMLFDDSVGGAPTWTVAELAAHIGRVTATAFPDDLWVEGQMRNLSRSANGHVYFDLAEPVPAGAPPRAQLAVTLLKPEKAKVNADLRRAGGAVRMEDGIEVRIQGRLRWYAPRGVLQLRMHGIDPAFTLGRLQADRDRILAALAADGLLAANAARPLPLVPLRIGLVTSVGSAAHADVLAELEASGLGFTVHVADARTQGPDCAVSVARALRVLGSGPGAVDLVLLVRGGGARTDLAGFDTDAVARAIATLPVPVFTGIGHEVDRSIADEVAHTSHKTPTAAAGAVVARVEAFLHRVDRCWSATRRAAVASAGVAAGRLDRRTARVGRAALRSLDRADQVLARHAVAAPRRAARDLVRAERDLDGLAARIRAHDPRHALARGWTITTTVDGAPVRDPAHLRPGAELVTRFAQASVHSTVTTVEPVSEEPTP